MSHSKLLFPSAVTAALCSVLCCSGPLGDSTGLGGGVIEDIHPGLVTIDRHIAKYEMDGSACDTGFSLPGPGDTAFGIHAATASYLVLGARNGERAAGYVRFACPPDTASARIFSANDAVVSVTLKFVRDTSAGPCAVEIWYSPLRSRSLAPSALDGDTLLATLNFTKDTNVAIPDSVVLGPGDLTDMIFSACTATVKDSAALAQRPVIGFIVTTPGQTDTIVRLAGNPFLTVSYSRDTSTTVRHKTYGSSYTSWYLVDDGNPDTLVGVPALSYASKRTAVFRYDAVPLWATIDSTNSPLNAQILSAVFSLRGPVQGDTLKIRYLLLPALERNGAALDSLFAAAPAKQSAATVRDTSLVLANVSAPLQHFMQYGRPSTLYLYLRFEEDIQQKWKRAVWREVPLLTAMIAVP